MAVETWGWHEAVSLPELGIERAFAKLDTGADRSCLHAEAVVSIGTGGKVEFTAPLLRVQRDCRHWLAEGVRRVRAKAVDHRIVRSSNGADQERWVIQTRLLLGSTAFVVRLGLTNRAEMRFPLLLGRDLLERGILVDSARAHVADGGSCPGPAP